MNKESQDMLKILQNLENASNNKTAPVVDATGNSVPTNISQDATEMYNILAKLHKVQDATDSAATNIVTESERLIESVNKATESVGIDKFNIVLEQHNISGYVKTYYTVAENGVRIYENLALFESAMAIIKNELFKNDVNKSKAILEYDSRYASALEEAAKQKRRQKTLTESIESDIAAAKHSVATEKMHKMKIAIKKLL
jgi:hypothetical protein|tara:strand:+ start:229 stop:828 length:600 start_codon:yes stop_codon:yes gene_type:complete